MNTKLVNTTAGVINAALTQNRTAAGIALALESAQLLMSPETAAELERLRQYAESRKSREEELLATMGRIDLREAPEAWALGMTVISHLEGPHRASAPEELVPGLRRLIEQLQARVAELETAPTAVYRASHDSIVMGLYTTAAEARKHCETYVRRELPSASLDWIEDEEDGVAELAAAFGEEEYVTGYAVTALEVASAYDEEADE
ncbi:hypothetical protein [Streptomyces sp. NPDC058614]|uniref:hypothetical protein n=1 Tax=Streptomyces sp. NPDC058614 TaxID=3346557 RepID=UPI003658C67C